MDGVYLFLQARDSRFPRGLGVHWLSLCFHFIGIILEEHYSESVFSFDWGKDQNSLCILKIHRPTDDPHGRSEKES